MNDNQDKDMAATSIRLSRISYPRANLWAMVLLVTVFLGFGIWAQATHPKQDNPAFSTSHQQDVRHVRTIDL